MAGQFVSTIGERIRRARRAAGLTQDQVAESLKVTRAAVATWEADRAAPAQPKWADLARVLRVPVGWLAVGDGSPGSPAGAPDAPPDAADEGVAALVDAIRAAARAGEYDVAAHAAEVLAGRCRRLGRAALPALGGAPVALLRPVGAVRE